MKMTSELKNIFLVCGLLAGSHVLAEESVPEIDCLIEPNMMIELSSPVSGVLDEILVDRSDTVTEGQIVATLKSDVEQVKLKAGLENFNLSRVEQKRSVELYRDGVITLSEKEQADHEAALNQLEVEHAQANLELRKIRSPIDGVVADRYLMPGEYIEDKPILKLAQLNPLRVEVVAPVTYFGRIKKGVHAQVKTEYGSFENLVAKVVVVDKVVDAASGTFGIRLELQNEDNQVPGGLKCTVRFFNEDEEAEYARRNSLGNVDTAISDSDMAAPDTAEPDMTEIDLTGLGIAEPGISEQSIPGEQENTICRRIGPFKKKDSLITLMNALENEINGYDVLDEITESSLYQVTTDNLASGETARSLKTEMKQAGVNDLAIVKDDAGYSISLGVFRNEKSAYKRVAKIKNLGYDCKVVPKQVNKSTYWAEVTANTSEDALAELVTASGVADTDHLLYQSCSTEILASGGM
jgi:membrane fusion protein (multidrug efflux system)